MNNLLHDLVYLCAAVPALVVARRYRRLPRVVPISVRPNGAPIAYGPRWLLFMPTLIIAVVLPPVALTLGGTRGGLRTQTGTALVYLLLIEVALFVALVLGIEAEVALGTLRRVPAYVQWGASAVLLATVVLTLRFA